MLERVSWILDLYSESSNEHARLKIQFWEFLNGYKYRQEIWTSKGVEIDCFGSLFITKL